MPGFGGLSGMGGGAVAWLLSRGEMAGAPLHPRHRHRRATGTGRVMGKFWVPSSPRECPSTSRDSLAAMPCRRVGQWAECRGDQEVSPRSEGIPKQPDAGKPLKNCGGAQMQGPTGFSRERRCPEPLACSAVLGASDGTSGRCPLLRTPWVRPRRSALPLCSLGERCSPRVLPGLLWALPEHAPTPRCKQFQERWESPQTTRNRKWE